MYVGVPRAPAWLPPPFRGPKWFRGCRCRGVYGLYQKTALFTALLRALNYLWLCHLLCMLYPLMRCNAESQPPVFVLFLQKMEGDRRPLTT